MRQKKNNSHRWQGWLIPVMIGITAFFLCAGETKNSSPQSPLEFITFAKDSELAYMFHIVPHPKSRWLYIWTVGIKELSTGKIVSKQTAQTMKGQENELHLKHRPAGSLIQITFRIHSTQPILFYTIKRTRGDQVVYRCKGKTKLEDLKQKK